jgi:hypothetical protein
MRKIFLVLLATCVVCLAPTAAWAQSDEEAAGNVSRVFLVEPKVGQEAQWLDAAEAHTQWHRDHKDPWTWVGFMIETGEDSGKYGWATANHWWGDFDEFDATLGEADDANFAITAGLYTQSYRSWFSVALPALSNPPPVGTVYPLYQVVDYQLANGRQGAFTSALGEIVAALNAGGWEGHYSWSERVGGDGPVYTLLIPLENWADMAEPERPFGVILVEQLGEEKAAELMTTVGRSTRSTNSRIVRVLQNLTHAPTE